MPRELDDPRFFWKRFQPWARTISPRQKTPPQPEAKQLQSCQKSAPQSMWPPIRPTMWLAALIPLLGWGCSQASAVELPDFSQAQPLQIKSSLQLPDSLPGADKTAGPRRIAAEPICLVSYLPVI